MRRGLRRYNENWPDNKQQREERMTVSGRKLQREAWNELDREDPQRPEQALWMSAETR